jgi:hypothetical protein
MITPDDVPGLLERLACGDAETQQRTLRQLCPCRSRCDDQQIWTAICRTLHDVHAEMHVRDAAFHALETLVNYARIRPTAKEILDWLLEQRLLWLPLEKPDRVKKQEPTREPRPKDRIRSNDLPRLLETLSCGDPHDQQKALQLLCPCRNARYDQEVWLAIFRAYESGEVGGHVRDQAFHAIETLRQRAKTDPRSQRLIQWLIDNGVTSLPLDENIPIWKPTGRAGLDGLYIPRYEPASRSRRNRRR